MRFEFIDVNGFHRLIGALEAILPAPPASFANAHPIRRLVTGALILAEVHKALQHPRLVVVDLLEVDPNPRDGQTQRLRCQIAARHTGTDQETVHADDPLQMRAFLFPVPPDPTFSVGQFQRRGAVAYGTKNPVFGLHQVSDHTPNRPSQTQWMLPDHQFVPHLSILLALHQDQIKLQDLIHTIRNPLRLGDFLPEPFVLCCQKDRPFGFQRAQSLQATVRLAASLFIIEIEPVAQILGQRFASKPAATTQQLADLFNSVILTKPFLNEIFCIHARNIRARSMVVQSLFVYKRQGKPAGNGPRIGVMRRAVVRHPLRLSPP